MKITRNQTGSYRLRCSEREFDVLTAIVNAGLVAGVEPLLTTRGQRQVWSQRTRNGPFLRVDTDKTEKFNDED